MQRGVKGAIPPRGLERFVTISKSRKEFRQIAIERRRKKRRTFNRSFQTRFGFSPSHRLLAHPPGRVASRHSCNGQGCPVTSSTRLSKNRAVRTGRNFADDFGDSSNGPGFARLTLMRSTWHRGCLSGSRRRSWSLRSPPNVSGAPANDQALVPAHAERNEAGSP
jgi:hypothetical protein